MKKKEIYDKAINSIVDYTPGDTTSCLMKEYAIKGMYNLLSCLDDIGLCGNATKLIALPDFTFSRNDKRYNSFFPYGSILYIDTLEEAFVPLGFRPNCCGITMLKLTTEDENIIAIKDRLNNIAQVEPNISSDDLNRGNHFIGIYKDLKNNQMYAIIHGSFNFVKSGHNGVPGLYIDKTDYWNDKMFIYNKNGFDFPYLIGDNAIKYFDSYLKHEQNTKKLRAKIAHYLFPNSKIVFNETHEGFYQNNTIMLGAYVKNQPFLAPIMLSAESDLPIVQIHQPISDIPSNLYICPHGGGYALKHIVNGSYDFDTQVYMLKFKNESIMETNDIRKLIYDYRTTTDLIWTDTYMFGDVVTRFSTIYNFKL